MYVTRYRPSRQMRNYRRGFNLLNEMLDSMGHYTEEVSNKAFSPSINTREGEYAYHLEVDLPGVNKEDVSIEVEDLKLTIKGERKSSQEVKEENYYRVESKFGSFERSFQLPENIDLENIHAESKDGVLELVIPKLEKPEVDKIKKIDIK